MVAGMNCFPCFTSQKSKKSHSKRDHGATPQENVIAKPPDMKKQRPEDANQGDAASINAKHFTFRELATATKNFRQECLLCEAGFGRVYKGIIPATGQAVAVKQFDRNGMHGSKEFLAEVYTLSLLHHENIVNFIGYCADGDQRLLVYDYVQGATLEDHLLATNADQPPLDWYTRMKVAAGVARGLEYLHDSANPPIIFKDLKPSDILLDTDHNAKLFDFGLGNHSTGDKMSPAPARVMGTYGYCAPEYVRTGQLTLKSDVYSFGVVLLELITGRRAVDTTRPHEEQNLVSWAQPLFRDPKRYPDMADPLLNKSFPEKDLNQAVAIAAMCLQEEAEARPLMSDVVTALSFLSVVHPAAPPAPLPHATSVSKESAAGQDQSESEIESGSESECESQSGSESASSYSRSSRRSSRRSRKGAYYSGSECGSACSSYRGSSKHHGEISQKKTRRKSSSRELSQKSSKKISTKELSEKSSKELSEKSSKKSSSADKELSQKSSRKSFIGGLGHKSTRKSSVRILSHKSTTSMGSQDGSFSMSRNSSSVVSDDEYERCSSRMLSRRNISFGLISSGSVNSSRRSVEERSMCCSMRSDEGSGHHYDRTSSSSGSHRGIVHSR